MCKIFGFVKLCFFLFFLFAQERTKQNIIVISVDFDFYTRRRNLPYSMLRLWFPTLSLIILIRLFLFVHLLLFHHGLTLDLSVLLLFLFTESLSHNKIICWKLNWLSKITIFYISLVHYFFCLCVSKFSQSMYKVAQIKHTL